MKSSDLKAIIAEIVKNELRTQLPAMVEKFLAERYIRDLVREERSMDRGRRGTSSLAETLDPADDPDGDPNERIPSPPRSRHQGIYAGDSKQVPRADEARRKLAMSVAPDIAALFEGTQPLDPRVKSEGFVPPALPTQQQFGEAGVPLSMLGLDSRAAELAKKMEARRTVTTTPAAEERRLQELRQRLEVPVNTPAVK